MQLDEPKLPLMGAAGMFLLPSGPLTNLLGVFLNAFVKSLNEFIDPKLELDGVFCPTLARLFCDGSLEPTGDLKFIRVCCGA